MGNFTPKQLKVFILFTALIFFSGFFLSLYVYPTEDNFSIMTHMVSYLGVPSKNPGGYIIFSISMSFLTLSYFPILLYIHRRVAIHRSKWFALIGTAFLFISIISILGVALIPDERIMSPFGVQWRDIHLQFAYAAIVGFLGGMFCYSEVFIEDWLEKRKNKSHHFKFKKFIVQIIIFIYIFIGIIYTQIQGGILFEVHPYPGIYSNCLWEWKVFITSFIVIYSLAIFLPNQPPDLVEYRKFISFLKK